MKYKNKEYSDNEILEILNNMEQQISDGASKLEGAQAKIKSYEDDILAKDNKINELKIKNYDLLSQVSVGVQTQASTSEEQQPKIISINDLLK